MYADFVSSKLSSPQQAAEALVEVTRQSGDVWLEFLKQKLSVKTRKEVANLYNNASPKTKQRLLDEFNALSEEEYGKFFGLAIIDEKELVSSHPSMANRFKFLEAIFSNPDILTCRDIKFDDAANITEGENCRPTITPSSVKATQELSPK